MEEQNKTEQDYLLQYLNDTDTNNPNKGKQPEPIKQPLSYTQVAAEAQANIEYLTFDAKMLPLGKFYPNGTVVLFRAAKVKEIQAYSMLDDTNYYDMIEKMNDMLASCARVKYSDGRVEPYTDIKDGDRLFLILLIRQMTFKAGNSLSVNAQCSCGRDISIELTKENFVYHEIPEMLQQYFNEENKTFVFKTVNDKTFELAPPSIGLQKSFTQYIIREYTDKKTPKMSFLKIMPFMLHGKNSISYDEIKNSLADFENIDDVSFQFLNSAINKMTLGIKELKKKCSCALEVHTDMVFPDGASSLFIVHDAFDKYIQK